MSADGNRIHLHEMSLRSSYNVRFSRSHGEVGEGLGSCSCHPASYMNINVQSHTRSSRCGAAHYLWRTLGCTGLDSGPAMGQRSPSVRPEWFPCKRNSKALQLFFFFLMPKKWDSLKKMIHILCFSARLHTKAQPWKLPRAHVITQSRPKTYLG